MKAREQRTLITQDRVLQELARIAFFDIRKLYKDDGTLKRPDELDDDAAAVLAGIDVTEMNGNDAVATFTKKAKVFDKTAALTLAMRHLGMLKDKTELTGKDGAPLQSGPPVIQIMKYGDADPVK
jgi:phage terminase small subunit